MNNNYTASAAKRFHFLYVCMLCTALNLECWTGTPDVHGFGGIPRDIKTLAECQAACIDSRTCVAIDWEPDNAGETCWLLSLPDTRATIHIGVIIHYELNPVCSCKSFLTDETEISAALHIAPFLLRTVKGATRKKATEKRQRKIGLRENWATGKFGNEK